MRRPTDDEDLLTSDHAAYETRWSIVRFQAFTLTELQKAQGDDAYREFLRRAGMSLGLYRLPAGKTDRQHPHATDEVYLVISGRATLQVEDRSIEVSTGSVVSVDHGVDHHFTDITEDLTLLVVFAPPTTPEA
jgi:mannose-6-phosphate isomerase-like protein (cupin superfamily)